MIPTLSLTASRRPRRPRRNAIAISTIPAIAREDPGVVAAARSGKRRVGRVDGQRAQHRCQAHQAGQQYSAPARRGRTASLPRSRIIAASEPDQSPPDLPTRRRRREAGARACRRRRHELAVDGPQAGRRSARPARGLVPAARRLQPGAEVGARGHHGTLGSSVLAALSPSGHRRKPRPCLSRMGRPRRPARHAPCVTSRAAGVGRGDEARPRAAGSIR